MGSHAVARGQNPWIGHLERSAPDRRPPEMVTLKKADTFGTQHRRVLGALDAFGHRGRTQTLDQTKQMAKKNPGLRTVRQISHQRAVDLDDVDRQDLKMSQRCVSGAKIVERNATSDAPQSVDKARRLGEIAQ